MAVPRKRPGRKPKSLITNTGVEVVESYCRYCMKTQPSKNFYKATDFLDANGLMSICKACCGKLYAAYYETEHSLEGALLKSCRTLNVMYSEPAIQATITHLGKTKREDGDPVVFGLYKSKIISTKPEKMEERDIKSDISFQEPVRPIRLLSEDTDSRELAGLKRFWGKSFDKEDLEFLEQHFADWSKTHKIDTTSEKSLLKFICIKELEIERCLIEGKSTSSLVKEYQELLKTSALSPSVATAASSGKSQETWGSFVKMIEETEPAEYYEDKQLFKDFDGIDKYFKKYILRPIKNFVTGSRDFNVEDEIVDEDETFTDELIYKPEEE